MNRIVSSDPGDGSDPATRAARVRVAELSGLRLLEAVHDPGQCIHPHAHSKATLLLSLGGEFSESVEGRPYGIQPLEVLWKPGGAVHANRYPLGARSFVIELDAEALALADDDDRSWEDVWHGRDVPAAICLALYRRVFGGEEPLAVDLEEAVVRLLEHIRGKRLEDRAAPARIRRVRDRLLDSIASPPTLRDLATEADLHPAHLCRVFRQQYGCAMGDLIRRARVERAVARLSDPYGGSLSDIAFALGYCDQAHFTRQFRHSVGVPPGVYRRMRRKQRSIQPNGKASS